MEVIIRKGEESDLEQVLDLIKELAVYEKAPKEVTNTLAEMREDGFGEKPIFEMYVAEQNDKLVGLALYYLAYSTWKGKTLYLEDLIVSEQYRRTGIGKRLFDAVALRARHLKAKRFAWQVLEWNAPAIQFYQKIGAKIDPEWLNCRMTEEEIAKYTSELKAYQF